MTLREWMVEKGLTLEAAAALFASAAKRPISASMVDRWAKPLGEAGRNVPRYNNMLIVEQVTAGAVPVDGWYRPPRASRDLSVSVAASRKAAAARRRQVGRP